MMAALAWGVRAGPSHRGKQGGEQEDEQGPVMMLSFKKAEKIRHAKDYQRVMRQGYKKVTPYFVVLYLPSSERRVGIIVSRRVHKSAVKRNGVKRRMREAYRQIPELLGSGSAERWQQQSWPSADVVLIGRQAILDVGFERLRADMVRGMLDVGRAVGRLRKKEQVQESCGVHKGRDREKNRKAEGPEGEGQRRAAGGADGEVALLEASDSVRVYVSLSEGAGAVVQRPR